MSLKGLSEEVHILGEAVDDLIARREKRRGGSSRPTGAKDVSPSAAPRTGKGDPLAGLARAAAALEQAAAREDPSVMAVQGRAGGADLSADLSPDALAGGAAPEGAAKAEAADLIRRAIARLRDLA